jgi:hypothetical protein
MHRLIRGFPKVRQMTERQWTVLSETATKILLGNGHFPGDAIIDVQEVVASETRLTRLKLFIEMIMESGTWRFSREPQPNLQQPHRSIRLFLLSRVNGDAPALTKARRLDDSRAGWFSNL